MLEYPSFVIKHSENNTLELLKNSAEEKPTEVIGRRANFTVYLFERKGFNGIF
jgi:hypothetical protein